MTRDEAIERAAKIWGPSVLVVESTLKDVLNRLPSLMDIKHAVEKLQRVETIR